MWIFLGEVYGFKEYPELLRAARELSAYLPETKVVDTKGILTKRAWTLLILQMK